MSAERPCKEPFSSNCTIDSRLKLSDILFTLSQTRVPENHILHSGTINTSLNFFKLIPPQKNSLAHWLSINSKDKTHKLDCNYALTSGYWTYCSNIFHLAQERDPVKVTVYLQINNFLQISIFWLK